MDQFVASGGLWEETSGEDKYSPQADRCQHAIADLPRQVHQGRMVGVTGVDFLRRSREACPGQDRRRVADAEAPGGARRGDLCRLNTQCTIWRSMAPDPTLLVPARPGLGEWPNENCA